MTKMSVWFIWCSSMNRTYSKSLRHYEPTWKNIWRKEEIHRNFEIWDIALIGCVFALKGFEYMSNAL